MAYGLGYAGGYGDVSTSPIVTVEVAFTTDPGATPTWTDISDYLEKEMTIHRGRSQELEQFSAGRATILLSNEDRRFDPSYTSSPYSPNVVPMRRVRVRATWSGTTYDVFNGYADGWEQGYRHPSVATCVLAVTDAFKVLANIELPSSPYDTEVRADNPAAWWRLGEPTGSTRVLDQVGSNHLDVNGAPTFGSPGLVTRSPDTSMTTTSIYNDGAQRSTAVLSGYPLSVEAIIKTTDNSNLILGQADAVSLPAATGFGLLIDATGHARWSVATTTTPFAAVTSTMVVNDGQPHHIVATWDAAGVSHLYVDGVATGTPQTVTGVFGAGQTTLIGAGRIGSETTTGTLGSYDEVAFYTTELSAARAAAHSAARATAWSADLSGARINRILDAAGWPAADRQIDTGVAVLQGADLGGTALAALQKVEETEQGRLFVTAAGKVRFISRDALIQSPYTTSQATFGDSGSELEYADLTYRYDDQTIYNEARVSRSGGTVQVAKDPTSQTRYLRRVKVIDGLLHTSDATSIDLGNWILAHYKDPLLRATGMKLEPAAGNETTHYPQVLGRELQERVTVRRRPQNVGSAIDQETRVEGLSHQVRGVEWGTDWNLSPADTQVYGVWDSAVALWDTARWSF